MFTDINNEPLFTEVSARHVFSHDGEEIDILVSNGNIWFHGSDVLRFARFTEHVKGGFGRTLKRVSPPDIIKIKDTPFRFPDGHRNRGSLISPRGFIELVESSRKGYNPIMAGWFTEWLERNLFTDGKDADFWSPARKEMIKLQPVFRSSSRSTYDETERDPLAPVGPNPRLNDGTPINSDEVQFCLCGHTCKCELRYIKPNHPPETDDWIDHGDDIFTRDLVAGCLGKSCP
ncbi:hypothetical protein [Ruegeria arenilitoris]|uniref:hypothetical protein n=1 Tax=Ruegeria arenilitoris TaxID=1173585 RepID=UPI00147DC9BE|nr:hypothetical protein [Ruegeria arenilitoris]